MYDMQEIVLQFAYIFAYFMISHLHFPLKKEREAAFLPSSQPPS